MQIPPHSCPADRGLIRSAHAETVHPDDVRSTHATALDVSCPEWVQLIPAGTFTGDDGRGPFRLTDPAAVVDLSMQLAKNGMPIDCGHALEEDGVVGTGAEAAGWITQLEVRQGSIWGKVDWTAMGKEKVGGKLFRYLSPVFYHDAGGVVRRLARAGLTNRPNLEMKSLNSSQRESHLSEKLKAAMSRLRALFALPETTDEDAVVARVEAALQAEQVATKVSNALALPKTATGDDVVAAVMAAKTPDPSKFVAMAQFTSVSDRLAKLVKADGERAIDAAVKAGKIQPVLKEHYLAAHARDPEGVSALIEKMVPVVAPGAAEPNAGGTTGAKITTLTAAQKEVCAATGQKEEDFLKTLNAKAAGT